MELISTYQRSHPPPLLHLLPFVTSQTFGLLQPYYDMGRETAVGGSQRHLSAKILLLAGYGWEMTSLIGADKLLPPKNATYLGLPRTKVSVARGRRRLPSSNPAGDRPSHRFKEGEGAQENRPIRVSKRQPAFETLANLLKNKCSRSKVHTNQRSETRWNQSRDFADQKKEGEDRCKVEGLPVGTRLLKSCPFKGYNDLPSCWTYLASMAMSAAHGV
ncbi:unnamed protein product [Nesidiocoris tenuis]|uniref:Uncharacterized protein n=1 Tax=Nesidiocoris tenuis TaxID=355587 RepID=A0A6H5H2X0_9HEMI|nr:unnamed protein product [Nesidiocoris tenuis]